MMIIIKASHVAHSTWMRCIYLIAIVLCVIGCGSVGQGTGGAVTPTRSIFVDAEVHSYDDLKTVSNVIIRLPAEKSSSRFRILFNKSVNGLDPAKLTVESIKLLFPEVTTDYTAGMANVSNCINIDDVMIVYYNNGDRVVFLSYDSRPTFAIGDSGQLKLPNKYVVLKSYLGEPERLLRPGELP